MVTQHEESTTAGKCASHVLACWGGFVVLIVLAATPVRAQLIFGEPTKIPNVNLDPPIGDQGPSTTSDGLSMYFYSRKQPSNEYPPGESYLYVASRETVNEDWGTPEPLPVELNQGRDSGPSISSDGLNLYFARGQTPGPAQPTDLYVATRETVASPWQTPQIIPGVDADNFYDLQPEISPNGLELYFLSNRPGGVGNDDLFVRRRADVSEPWGEPENVSVVNTIGYEGGPNLSADGLQMFFYSAVAEAGAPLRSSDFDLWMAERDSLASPWNEPTRLPEHLNQYGLLEPDLSWDGGTLYLSLVLVDTPNLDFALTQLDLWQVPVVPEPNTAVLMLLGLLGYAGRMRKRVHR